MQHDDTITLFHAPQTRSTGTLVLLEELGAPYGLNVLNMKAGDQKKPDYLALNPMGKVPAIRHRGALVTEQVAIFLYLADVFANAGLTPQIGDPLRGPYLRWMVFYASCYEPALVDKAAKREPAAPTMTPYGDFETMLGTITTAIAHTPYLLGDKVSAADILWGNALRWGTLFGLVPKTKDIEVYVARIVARPAFAKVMEMDAKLSAEQEKALPHS